MKARFLWATVMVLILLSLPVLVLAQPPISSSAKMPGDDHGFALPASSDVLWDQYPGDSLGVISQYFPDYGLGIYSADDFRNDRPWDIESISVAGYAQNSGNLTYSDSLHWLIYPDNMGKPAGYPGTGGELWSYTCLPSAPEVTISGSLDDCQVALDIVQALGAPLYLPPGTYWLCFYPSLNLGLYGGWCWSVALGITNLASAQVIDPTDFNGQGFTSWTPWSIADFHIHDAVFRLEGTVWTRPPTRCPLDEDFSSWLPYDWETDDWHQSNSNYTGGTSPEARLAWYNISGNYSYLDCETLDTTGLSSLTLEFKSFIESYYGGYYNCTVYTRAHAGDKWTDVTPWTNPIYSHYVGPSSYSVDISGDVGRATQVRFEFDGWYEAIRYWYVDDVSICGPPPPVGGEAYPVNKASLLSPWIAVGALIGSGISWYVLRRRRAQS